MPSTPPPRGLATGVWPSRRRRRRNASRPSRQPVSSRNAARVGAATTRCAPRRARRPAPLARQCPLSRGRIQPGPSTKVPGLRSKSSRTTRKRRSRGLAKEKRNPDVASAYPAATARWSRPTASTGGRDPPQPREGTIDPPARRLKPRAEAVVAPFTFSTVTLIHPPQNGIWAVERAKERSVRLASLARHMKKQ